MSKYRIQSGEVIEFDFEDIRKFAQGGKKISLIKEVKRISGMGLKDSKDAIEKHIDRNGFFNVDALKAEFAQYLVDYPQEYTKAEFMSLVENAIDNMDTFQFLSMTDAVEALLTNIKRKGGLKKIAEERDDFLEGI